MQPQNPLTDAQRDYIRRTITNGDALIRDLEREASTPESVDIEKLIAQMYRAFSMGAANAVLPSEPTPDTTREDSEHE